MKSVRMSLPWAVLAGAVITGFAGADAVASETRGYVVNWFQPAMYSTKDDCPGGNNLSAEKLFERILRDQNTPPADIEKVRAGCKDGKAVVDQANKDVTVGDCASVEITAGNAVVHLGNVEELVVSGSINDIAAKQVGSVRVTTDGNRLTSDNEPEVSDDGEDNVFRTR